MKTSLVRLCYAAAILAVASYAYVTLQGPRGLRALLQKEASIAEMENINTKLSRDNEQKRDYIHRLGGDSKVQEQVIRQELKLVHPDEKVFITGPPPVK